MCVLERERVPNLDLVLYTWYIIQGIFEFKILKRYFKFLNLLLKDERTIQIFQATKKSLNNKILFRINFLLIYLRNWR